MKQGKAIIFSAPSGSGKTTIVRHLLRTYENMGFSISACTRPQRKQNEVNGKDYYFLTPEKFKQKINEGAFVEWEQVYDDLYYGTLKSEIERIWGEGKHILFDVDVKGGLSLKRYFQDRALAVFVKAPSLEELARRLRYRNTESDKSFEQRVAKAESEMAYEKDFDVTLINANLADTLKTAEALIEGFIQDKQQLV